MYEVLFQGVQTVDMAENSENDLYSRVQNAFQIGELNNFK